MNDNNFKLHIDDIALNDRGHYQCQAENLVGRSQQIFNVQVFGKYQRKKKYKSLKINKNIF